MGKSQIENFQMIELFFGETAGFPESPPDTMSEPAIITSYPNGTGFSDDLGIRGQNVFFCSDTVWQ